MLTLEHDRPPGLSPYNFTTDEILLHTTKQARAIGNDAYVLRRELSHWATDAGHFLVKLLQTPENTWAARFLVSRGFHAEPLQEILEDHLTGKARPKVRIGHGLTDEGHWMFKVALRLTLGRNRYPVDIPEIIAGALLSRSPVIKDMILASNPDVKGHINGLLINGSRN